MEKGKRRRKDRGKEGQTKDQENNWLGGSSGCNATSTAGSARMSKRIGVEIEPWEKRQLKG